MSHEIRGSYSDGEDGKNCFKNGNREINNEKKGEREEEHPIFL